jgi:antitoxin component of RelBE/YafQ-DinJ toxin-antitoxin module
VTRTQINLRLDADVLAAAKSEAARRGETLTAAVVRFLKRYGKGRG